MFNFLITIILVGFAIGLTYITYTYPHPNNAWGLLYIPLIIMMIAWGCKINDDYKFK